MSIAIFNPQESILLEESLGLFWLAMLYVFGHLVDEDSVRDEVSLTLNRRTAWPSPLVDILCSSLRQSLNVLGKNVLEFVLLCVTRTQMMDGT
ncbi:hypothetical protein BB8028_0002g01890 [Beauveria bassiana]|uniref:Uncharacterized protein n=1 Tax=Beauveria bassiana TaxID=176275 RepID=A0A2S7Y116_BEABA|nr:hypothetical protein BB8028_0002g01890 [Beauveria bassiana]